MEDDAEEEGLPSATVLLLARALPSLPSLEELVVELPGAGSLAARVGRALLEALPRCPRIAVLAFDT